MSGFAQMAGALARVGELHSVGATRSSGVRSLRQHIIAGRKTSAQLEQLLGLTNQQVWGRLKRDLDCGRVVREGDYWVWKGDQETPAIRDAIELLRANGYAVQKIKRKPDA